MSVNERIARKVCRKLGVDPDGTGHPLPFKPCEPDDVIDFRASGTLNWHAFEGLAATVCNMQYRELEAQGWIRKRRGKPA